MSDIKLTPDDLEEMLDNAARRGAKEALRSIGLLDDDAAASSNRATRNDLMLETDWWASSDLTMTSAQTTYRQALRDMPTHSNWPNLDDNDWPTKP